MRRRPLPRTRTGGCPVSSVIARTLFPIQLPSQTYSESVNLYAARTQDPYFVPPLSVPSRLRLSIAMFRRHSEDTPPRPRRVDNGSALKRICMRWLRSLRVRRGQHFRSHPSPRRASHPVGHSEESLASEEFDHNRTLLLRQPKPGAVDGPPPRSIPVERGKHTILPDSPAAQPDPHLELMPLAYDNLAQEPEVPEVPKVSIWAGLPRELWIMIIEHAVDHDVVDSRAGGDLPDFSKVRASRKHLLCSLSLACHASFDICSSALYSSLAVSTDRIDDFVRFLREGTVHVARLSTSITISGLQPLAAYTKAVRLASLRLPRLSTVVLHCGSQPPNDHTSVVDAGLRTVDSTGTAARNLDTSVFHSAHYPFLAPVLRSAPSEIHHLVLDGCSFASDLDLLRVLSAFPSPSVINLRRIQCTHATSAPAATHLQFSACLRYISLEESPGRTPSLDLKIIHAWMHPRPHPSSRGVGFPGLGGQDAIIIIGVYHCLLRKLDEDVRIRVETQSRPDDCMWSLLTPSSAADGQNRRNRDCVDGTQILSH